MTDLWSRLEILTFVTYSAGMYTPFDELTINSFRHACRDAGLSISAEHEHRIMDAYSGLSSFPDAQKGLFALAGREGSPPLLDAWVFSNGTKQMIESSLATSHSLGPAATAAGLDVSRVVSVDDGVRVYKPDPRAYLHMMAITSRARANRTVMGGEIRGPADMATAAHVRHDTWLVSSNPFDALGAVAAGLKSAWVDRKGRGWVDGLAGALGMRPTVVVKGVDEAVEEIIRRSGAEDINQH